MRILFIDLASNKQMLSCVTEQQTVASVSIDDHKDESLLLPAFEKLLSDARWSQKDLTHIAAVLGPGGFMSLRVGIAMTNALSYACAVPSAGLHVSDLCAARVSETKDFLWLHSTKKSQLFIRGFGKFAGQWNEAQLIEVDELKKQSLDGIPFVGELIPEQRSALPVTEMENLRSIEQVLPALLAGLEYKKGQTLLPWYGRGA